MPNHSATHLRPLFLRGRLKPAVLALAVATAFGALPAGLQAQTLPSGGVAVHGQAVISQPSPNHLRVVTQNGAGTSHSAINWQSFSISAGATATIQQPNAASLSINRVVTNTPSAIFGNLSSNGRLVLVNQSGIAVGAGAVIDTAGFTASALRMSDADALAGRLRFGEPGASMGGAAGLTVGGAITAREGDIVLVAPNIDLGTKALLKAPNGSTILAAGQQVEITGRGLEGITMLVQAPADQARNLGRLEGSAVGIFAGTLRHSGEIQATTATLEGGTVVLKAGGDALVEGAGKVIATGTKGGNVDVLGRRVAVMDQAVIDVSGDNGGGNIRIGGDYQGKNAAVTNALRSYLGPDAHLRADAGTNGDGGRIIVWGDEVTRAYGSISARGGLVAGNGGFAEVSGLKGLVFEAAVDLRAPHGLIGTLLLDPDFIDIVNGGSDPVSAGDQFADPSSSVAISPAALQAVGGNVMLQSNGDITFSDPVNLTTAGANLTALAGNAIRVDASITTNGGNVTLHSAAPGSLGTGSSDSDAVYVNAAISSNGGTIQLVGDSCDLFCDTVVIGANVNAGGGTVVITATGGDARQTAGAITAATLFATADATIDLNLSSNNISGNVNLITDPGTAGSGGVLFHNSASAFTLENAVSKDNITIAAAGTLTTTFLVQSTGGNVSINALGGMSLGNDVDVAGTLTLLSNNATITQTAGAVLAGGATTVNAGTGNVLLSRPGNDFNGIALSGGAFNVQSASALTVTSLTRNVSNADLFLRANGGNLTLPAGNIDAGTGEINLRGTGVLTTPGILTAGTVMLQGSGGINITNNINSSVILELTASSGTISQSGGQIVTIGSGTTILSAAGVPVNLTAPGNDFGAIFGTTGSLNLVDQNNIVVSSLGGGISATAGNILLSATGIGSTSLQGSVNAGSGTVTINTRGLTQSGGSVTASTLTVNSSLGSISLPQANNVAAARFTGSGASTIDFNNQATSYTLSGTGGTLTVTGGGHVTVDQPLNFASGIDITSAGGITLGANVTPGGNLALSASTGLIEQTAGTLFANSGTATINAGSGDIALTSASNQFNVVNLAGGHITLLASSGLIVNTLSSGLGQNVFLDAGAGTLLLPATPINAGTGQITLTSGGDLLLGGALIGSDILLSASTGLSIAGNISASGFLNMGSTSGGVSQSAGTAVVVAGTTSVGSGTAAITLNEAGNNFSTVEATGGVITLRDANALNLGAVNAGTSLTVQANGNVTQTAPVLVSGTTTVNAGSGNVTLTTAGNNLNVLSVSGNAINVVEGAGSSLTVTSLTSGPNQPVSLSAGHTLTLPGAAINTGTADLTLSSAIGPLTIPAALNGNNISLSAVTGLTVNAPITAIGDFNATVSGGGSTMTVNRQVSAGADMALTLAGNLSILAGASGAAGLTAAGDQTIAAVGDILLQGAVSGTGNRASIQATGPAGTQSVTANGITLLGGNGSFNSASIKSAGSQEVTVGNGGIAITGGGGSQAGNLADIDHVGPAGTHQLITVNGTGSISLQGGSAAGGDSEASIRSEFGDSQTVTFTGGGAGRAITLVGGTVGTDSYAEIWVGAGTQLITGAGQISLTGGASGGGLSFGGGDLLGNVAVIAADSNDQTIVASGIAVQGGAAGLNNLAGIFGAGEQSITVGAGGLFLGGGSGGGADLKNAAIVWKGSDVPGTTQTISVGGGGSVMLQGGSASRQNVGTDADFAGLSNGAFAAIRSEGTAQLIEFTAPGGSIQLAGGTVGSDNHAFIFAQAGTQTIRGATSAQAPTISATGGASGGLANEGNRAAIIAEAGNQVISAASIALQGGAAGTENVAQIRQGSVSTGLSSTQMIDIVTSATSALQGGGGTTNLARIQAYGTAQTVGLAAGSNLNLSGGTGASFNFARIEALNGDQTITGSGAISVVGGASGGASGQGNFADIRSRGTSNTQSISARSLTIAGGAGGIENDASVRADGDQTVSLQTSGSNALVIGNAGAAHASSLTGNNQTVTAGSGSQSGSITIVGGTAAGKNAGIFANVVTPNSGTQTISTTGSLSLTGGTATGTSTCDAASSGACADIANDGSGLQTITANAVQMQGGASGIANGAGIFQRGGDLLLTVGAGGLTMTGGSGGSNNFATIGGSNANGSTLTLDVTGNIVMDALNATTGSGALIGLGGVGSGNSVTIDVTASGALTMRGSDVAATGSAIGANNTQTASTTNISIDAASVSMLGGSAGPARIGSAPLLPGGGDISLLAAGAVSLQGAVAGNAVIHTLGRVDVEGSTLDIRNTVSGNEVSLLGTAGVSLSGAASVNANAPGTALKVIVDTGAFSNTAGASALLAPSGRWLVYSVDPANDTRGSLAHDFKQYDAVPGDTVLGTGNGLLYSLPAPSITATLVGVVSKTYDGTDVATLSAGNYSAAGIDGDVIQLNNPTTGTYDTKAVGSGKSVVAGSLSLVSAVDASAKPVFGYNPTVSPAGGLVGEITAASITAVTGITAVNKVYDATPSATLVTSGAVFAGKAAGDNLVLSSATGTFDTKDVGTGKTVTVTGLGLSGTDAGNYILSATSATTTGNITPATISGITGITAANKVYDGGTGALLTTSGAAFTGRLGSDVLSVATAVGNFSDKNVANPKTVNITGLSLGGTDAGNYTLASTTATTAAAITPATITGVSGLSATKVYDGNAGATAVNSGAAFFTGAFLGDNLTVAVASANFSDRNVGTGKVLTATGLTLGGADAGNYILAAPSASGTGTITQRPVSTWTGGGGDGLWSNPLNWDALPDGSNVAAASIPAGAGTVIFNGAVAATSLQTLSALSPFTMAGSSLSVSSTLAVEDFGQSGGALGGTGSLVVTNSFSQGGGSIAMGNITIVQNAGNLSFSNISGNTVALVAPAGSISQSGPLVASTLTTSSDTGTALTQSGNQISNLYAENLGSGAITVASNGALNVLGLDNAGGNLAVSTNGPMSAFGPVTASGNVTLSANGSGGSLGIFAPVTASGNVTLAANGSGGSLEISAPVMAGNQVVLSAADTLTQDAAVVGANGVTGDAGVSIVFGALATANYQPVVYRIAGISFQSPPEVLVPPPPSEESADTLVEIAELVAQLANPNPPPKPDDFNADGTRKKPSEDTIVTEGEVCK